jgi:hypothetical protein
MATPSPEQQEPQSIGFSRFFQSRAREVDGHDRVSGKENETVESSNSSKVEGEHSCGASSANQAAAPDGRNDAGGLETSTVEEETTLLEAEKADGEATAIFSAPAPSPSEQNQRNVGGTEKSPVSGEDEEKPPEDAPSLNPFAKFAFSVTSMSQPTVKPATTTAYASIHWVVPPSKKQKIDDSNRHGQSKSKKTPKDFVRMRDCSPEERERIVEKWHSLADPNAQLEVRRYQILVAARLHARCQDPVVRQTMGKLRELLASQGGLTVQTVAELEPETTLAPVLSSLQYYNTKAKHVVAAAKEIQASYNGLVPETEAELLKITGIGPVMADLLAYVNTRERHSKQQIGA